jgi:hypothetical protein
VSHRWMGSLKSRRWRDGGMPSFCACRCSRCHHSANSHCARGDSPQRCDSHRLTPGELHLYNDLRDDRVREGLRLEQEHLGFGGCGSGLINYCNKTE